MIIMKVPENATVHYATHTNINVDQNSKEITGYPSKYESGRKQLAIFQEGDDEEKKIEEAKRELKTINQRFSNFLQENDLDPQTHTIKKRSHRSNTIL